MLLQKLHVAKFVHQWKYTNNKLPANFNNMTLKMLLYIIIIQDIQIIFIYNYAKSRIVLINNHWNILASKNGKQFQNQFKNEITNFEPLIDWYINEEINS